MFRSRINLLKSNINEMEISGDSSREERDTNKTEPTEIDLSQFSKKVFLPREEDVAKDIENLLRQDYPLSNMSDLFPDRISEARENLGEAKKILHALNKLTEKMSR